VASDLGKAGGFVLVQPSVRSVAVPAKSGEKYGGAVLFATSRTFLTVAISTAPPYLSPLFAEVAKSTEQTQKVAKSTNLPYCYTGWLDLAQASGRGRGTTGRRRGQPLHEAPTGNSLGHTLRLAGCLSRAWLRMTASRNRSPGPGSHDADGHVGACQVALQVRLNDPNPDLSDD
jgi:hypothetical protein